MPDHATFYIADPSLLGTRLFAHFTQIKRYEGLSEGSAAVGLKLTLPAATLTLNFMSEEKTSQHLQGFAGWVEHVLHDQEQLIYVLSRMRNIRLVMGGVIEPDLDEQGAVQQFLFEFNDRLNGLLFFHNTIFDFDGEPIAGYFYDASAPHKPQ